MARIRILSPWAIVALLVFAVLSGCGSEPGNTPPTGEPTARERAVFRVPGMT